MARQELIEAYIECCKKRKKIESVEVSKGLDGHDGAKLMVLIFREKKCLKSKKVYSKI